MSDKTSTLLRQYQLHLVDLLKEFNQICVQNNIQYSLAYGSLLGAVRHKGFIPWDDDIDVMMDRTNYEKLLPIIKRYHPIDGYFERPLWLYKFVKKTNIDDHEYLLWVDILVMDNIPSNHYLSFIKTYTIIVLQGMIKRDINHNHSFFYVFLSSILLVFGYLLPRKTKLWLYDFVSSCGKSKDCEYCKPYNGVFNYVIKEKHRMPLFTSFENMMFEDTLFPVISNRDRYLTELYGDYMTPPPPQLRVPTHNF